jgi:membrane protease YdiL (CAAX protease family)
MRADHRPLKRLAYFLRSVIPVDPWQLCLLMGCFVLILAPRVTEYPTDIEFTRHVTTYYLLASAILVAILEVALGVFALYSCFWPGRRPLRRLLFGVLVPTTPALIYVVWFLNYQQHPESDSLFAKHIDVSQMAALLHSQFWHLSTRFYFFLAAFLLIGIFAARMASGASTLPVELQESVCNEHDGRSWRAVLLLNVQLIGGVGLILANIFAGTVFLLFTRARFLHADFLAATSAFRAGWLLGTVALVALAAVVLGEQGRREARRSLRFPGVRFLLLGAALIVVITAAGSGAQFLFDRAQWAAHRSGLLDPPQPADYFGWIRGWKYIYLVLVPAFAEELIFRGAVLPACIRRFGLYRGIFLQSVGFTAIHFSSDSYGGLSPTEVLVQIFWRAAGVLVFSYVVSWVTLRSYSILPAWIGHSFCNSFNEDQRWALLDARWQIVAWITATILLYIYFPPTSEIEQSEQFSASDKVIPDASAS